MMLKWKLYCTLHWLHGNISKKPMEANTTSRVRILVGFGVQDYNNYNIANYQYPINAVAWEVFSHSPGYALSLLCALKLVARMSTAIAFPRLRFKSALNIWMKGVLVSFWQVTLFLPSCRLNRGSRPLRICHLTDCGVVVGNYRSGPSTGLQPLLSNGFVRPSWSSLRL